MTRVELSALLEAEMAARGWTVRDLARESGVTYEIVRRVVRGIGSTSVDTATRILVPFGYELKAVPFLKASA